MNFWYGAEREWKKVRKKETNKNAFKRQPDSRTKRLSDFLNLVLVHEVLLSILLAA